MLRYISRKIRPVCYCSIIPFFSWKNLYDEIDRSQKTVPKTGFERMVALFEYDSKGYSSKEYTSAMQLTVGSTILGFFYGLLQKVPEAREQYLMANQQTRYLSAYEAGRKLNDYIFMKSANCGLRYGAKFGIITGIYSFTVILIAAYRNEDGILEFFTGGFLAGAFARCYLGWKATFAGGTVGGMMGAFIGTIGYFSGRFGSNSISDIRQWQYDINAYVIEEKQRADKESVVLNEVEGPLLKQKILRSKYHLGYQTEEDKVFVISNPDSTNTDSNSMVINSIENTEFLNNANQQNPEPSMNQEIKETH